MHPPSSSIPAGSGGLPKAEKVLCAIDPFSNARSRKTVDLPRFARCWAPRAKLSSKVANDFRLWPIATEIHVPWHVGDQLARDPFRTWVCARDNDFEPGHHFEQRQGLSFSAMLQVSWSGSPYRDERARAAAIGGNPGG